MSDVRLIDANALKILPDRFKNYYHIVGARGDGKSFQTMTLGVLAKVQETIDNAPTIDAVPVVHGRWNGWHGDKRMKNGEYRHFHYYACDQCECRTAIASNYCPHCGAKMDGGASDGSDA